MSRLYDETDDDVRLPGRRSLSEDRGRERTGGQGNRNDPEREVTLNTGIVLALFFTLALICAVFFGFGYSMGRKSAQTAAAAAIPAPIENVSSGESDNAPSSAKPAPGSPVAPSIPGYMTKAEATAANDKAVAAASRAAAAIPITPSEKRPAAVAAVPPAAAPASSVPKAVPIHIPSVTAPAPAPSTAAPVAGMTYVQIAAVSHQEDATVLLSALQRRGYKVLERSDPADHLIHVQIGPFANRKDAEVTRQKLLADGYNAFLK